MQDRFDDDAPRAAIRPTEVTVHGTVIRDEYAWLKAENWKEVLKDASLLPAEIGNHLRRENAHTDRMLSGLTGLRERLVAEMRARIKEDESSVPEPDGPYAYFTRYREGGQHPLVCRGPRGGSEPRDGSGSRDGSGLHDGDTAEILLDGDEEAGSLAFFELADYAHSPDHRRLAWSADVTGAELNTIRVRDLATGEDLGDEIPATTAEIVWAADSSALYYVEVDDNHRPVRVKRHRLGTDLAEDTLVYEETIPGWFVAIDTTTSRRFMSIEVNDHETSEIRLIDLEAGDAEPFVVAPRTSLVIYSVEHHGEELIIRTNDGGAVDFKLVSAPLASPDRAGWTDLVPHRPGTMILSHLVLAGHLVRLERQDANPRIVVRDLATGEEHAIRFEEEAYSLSLRMGFEFDTTVIRFVYSSMTTPSETYDYDCATRERVLRKRQEIPSGFDPARYVTRRIFGRAADGATIPISLVHRADLPRDGSALCLLYGYGSYGSAIPAHFRTNLLSLVDRGFVYAIAHIRGGTEKGWNWYLDGKREKKPNTFSDFIACADMLIGQGFTHRGGIVGHGGSAGGMLMGAVANMGEDRFAGIVADVPFVDVLHTMLDGELPLTPPEWPEWGNPGTDIAAFRTILSYSPYENVRAQPYPAILALGGLTDPRVTYWEPAKWVARLRATMTGGGPILLKTNMDAGHGGAPGRFDRLDEVGLIYSFALWVTGRAEAEVT